MDDWHLTPVPQELVKITTNVKDTKKRKSLCTCLMQTDLVCSYSKGKDTWNTFWPSSTATQLVRVTSYILNMYKISDCYMCYMWVAVELFLKDVHVRSHFLQLLTRSHGHSLAVSIKQFLKFLFLSQCINNISCKYFQLLWRQISCHTNHPNHQATELKKAVTRGKLFNHAVKTFEIDMFTRGF